MYCFFKIQTHKTFIQNKILKLKTIQTYFKNQNNIIFFESLKIKELNSVKISYLQDYFYS